MLKSMSVCAYDFEIDGILYNLYSNGVIVTHNENLTEFYTGDIVIPEQVTYQGITYRVVSIDEKAFWDSRNLKSVTLPRSITSIGRVAFQGCKSLTAIKIPNSVKTIQDELFRGCDNLSEIVVEEGNSEYDSREGCNAIIETKTNTLIAGCNGTVIPSSVLEIGSRAFVAYTKPSIVIPGNIKTIGWGAFNYTPLTSITLSEGVTTIGHSAFAGCSALERVIMPNSVKVIEESAFFSCTSLVSIVIPKSVESIEHDTFFNCTSLKNVSLPDGLKTINYQAFWDCTALESISIPRSITTIGGDCFKGCTSLKSISLPMGVTTIVGNAFLNCKALASIKLPKTLTKIGDFAFSGCNNLKEIHSYIETPFASQKFGFVSDVLSNAILYVPEGKLGVYQKTDGWSYFRNIVERKDELSENSTFTAPTVEGVEMTFRVIDVMDKRVEVYGTANSPSVPAASSGTITIPESVNGYTVTSIGPNAFYNCYNLTEVVIPLSITTIEDLAFYSCLKLSKVVVPESVTVVGKSAFMYCKNLQYVSLPNSLSTIGFRAFSGCVGLTSITLPVSLTSIGGSAFSGCTGLTSVVIPENVNSIGVGAFSECANLVSVTLLCGGFVSQDSPKTWDSKKKVFVYDSYKTIFGDQVKHYVLGNTVQRIGSYVFSDCVNVESIFIPASVSSVGIKAFDGCTGLKKVIVPDVAAWCGISFENYPDVDVKANPLFYAQHLYIDENTEITNLFIPEGVENIAKLAFANCDDIVSISFPKSLKTIGGYAFYGCDGLTTVDIPEGVTDISNAFMGCTNLSDVRMPTTLTGIVNNAFKDCNSLVSVTLPDNLEFVLPSAFPETTAIYVRRGSLSLLALWESEYVPFDMENQKELLPPVMEVVSTTQTTATLKFSNLYDEYQYCLSWSEPLQLNEQNEMVKTGLAPEVEVVQGLYAVIDFASARKIYCCASDTIITQDIRPAIESVVTASSIRFVAHYIHGDAEVESETLKVDGTVVNDSIFSMTGLNPNTSIKVEYSVNVKTVVNTTKTYSVTERRGNYIYKNIILTTKPLEFKTMQPKVISVGNVIVAAEANLDDEEQNIGFEWRRTDWTDDFASSTGNAILFEGVMEGYIRNMNAEKLWKYRPYYLSDSGTYYYGDWVGLDPSNTSYFEPTVHTYAKTSVEGNTALVKGYALRGTDGVKIQGFKYWKRTANARGLAQTTSIPGDAMTVEASGQVMIASLTDLDFESSYCYVAFVTTTEGETFYGEQQSFVTGADPTGIEDATTNSPHVTIVARYDASGRRIKTARRGLNILQKSDGTSLKVWVK